ncbi:MAG: hypothetical protein R2706_09785 [Acidimicrobiales bacterium]
MAEQEELGASNEFERLVGGRRSPRIVGQTMDESRGRDEGGAVGSRFITASIDNEQRRTRSVLVDNRLQAFFKAIVWV